MKDSIFKRDFEQIFIKNSSWSEFTTAMYNSNCKEGDAVCEGLLEGAIEGGWPSSIIQFTTALLDLYDAVKSPRPYSAELNANIMSNLIELHFAYMRYMRDNIRKFKEYTFSRLISSLNECR